MGLAAFPDLALREKDVAILQTVFQKFISVLEVRVFGSRATGQARRASDLDLAISAPEASISEWAKIVETLEECPIIYELDVVRVERTRNARLIEKIDREGISIYPPQ